jgi:hypothetical protein
MADDLMVIVLLPSLSKFPQFAVKQKIKVRKKIDSPSNIPYGRLFAGYQPTTGQERKL